MSDVTIYISNAVPNPMKLVIAAEELGVTYKLVHKDFGDGPNGIKSPDFLKINPNGRVPALVDHTNGDYVIWESGAILLYLVERFDKENKLFATDLKDRTDIHVWLYFSNSGQNVMTEQAVYWKHFHPIKDIHDSVYERYKKEAHRTWDVLEKRLAEQGDYICGHHFTIVDCSVLPCELYLLKF